MLKTDKSSLGKNKPETNNIWWKIQCLYYDLKQRIRCRRINRFVKMQTGKWRTPVILDEEDGIE